MISMPFFTYKEAYCENISIKAFYLSNNQSNLNNETNHLNEDLRKVECLEINKNDIERDAIIKKILFFLNFIFCIEVLIKMIAMGFLLNKNAYLRKIPNLIDFFVTINSFLEYFFPYIFKGKIFRVFSLIRALGQIGKIISIKRQIESILNSLPMFIKNLHFLTFILIILATLGILLFSGAFYNRCREQPYP